MIKLYKNITDYASQNWMHRNTASKKFKNWELDLIEVPKGVKWIDKRSVCSQFIIKTKEYSTEEWEIKNISLNSLDLDESSALIKAGVIYETNK